MSQPTCQWCRRVPANSGGVFCDSCQASTTPPNMITTIVPANSASQPKPKRPKRLAVTLTHADMANLQLIMSKSGLSAEKALSQALAKLGGEIHKEIRAEERKTMM
jgi:hypothetical protein